jgi:hypothetical protein
VSGNSIRGTSINIVNNPIAQTGEVRLPDVAHGRTRLKSFAEEIIEMSRDLETSDPPFLVEESDGRTDGRETD